MFNLQTMNSRRKLAAPSQFPTRKYTSYRLFPKNSIEHCGDTSAWAASQLVVFVACSNVAEALVSKGLGKVVRYRMDDDQRSSAYDPLLAAEARAQKKGVGVHSKKDASVIHVADVSGVSGSARRVGLLTVDFWCAK